MEMTSERIREAFKETDIETLSFYLKDVRNEKEINFYDLIDEKKFDENGYVVKLIYHTFDWDEETFSFLLRENYEKLLINFIENNYDKYKEDINKLIKVML